ncbi:MAG: sigma-70 family RNA polymerase sigma factor [Bacteroidales bacterium]|nr:sigma-70 family RNA polymerase sigma factor [Bacteroidales bacterium]
MDKKLLKDWVALYTDEMLKWAYHKTSSTQIAEDLVQETFLVAVEKHETFKGESSAKTWLFSILNHKIIDYYRKKVHQPVLTESSSFSTFFEDDSSWKKERAPQNWHEDSHLLDQDDFAGVLKLCLDALPETWNLCVKLKYLSGKSGEEICQEVGITPTNFWQIVHRAKLQLRDCIDNKWFKN